MNVAVVGLGKIGLPLAVQIAGRGHAVKGLDVAPSVVELVNDGRPPFPGEPDLDTRLQSVLSSGGFRATSDPTDAIGDADVVIVVVPLIVDAEKRPDFSALDAATEAVGGALRAGALVSYETTLPVGTTRTRFAAQLEKLSGLTLGDGLFVCHSPERVSSGRVFRDLRTYPKLVGGTDPDSTRRAAEFYRSALDFDDRPDLGRPNGVWELANCEAAELAKLAETTYRDINIAFANELAVAAEGLGIDVRSVIEACNSQPFSHIHQPGIAVGGHCIPVYPWLLMSTVDGFEVPLTARRVNDRMPAHAVATLSGAFGGLDGRRVVVLGLAFRGGVKEDAFSGAYPLVEALAAAGAVALVADPLYTADEIRARGLTPYVAGDPCDAAIVQADHAEYRDLRPSDLPGVQAVYDGRAVLSQADWDHVRLVTVGSGS